MTVGTFLFFATCKSPRAKALNKTRILICARWYIMSKNEPSLNKTTSPRILHITFVTCIQEKFIQIKTGAERVIRDVK